jgi:hypothetical protein
LLLSEKVKLFSGRFWLQNEPENRPDKKAKNEECAPHKSSLMKAKTSRLLPVLQTLEALKNKAAKAFFESRFLPKRQRQVKIKASS